MDEIQFRQSNTWTTISFVLLIPPMYFWTFGLLYLLGAKNLVGITLLDSLPDILAVILVLAFPALALIFSIIARRKRKGGIITLLLVLSVIFVILAIIIFFVRQS